MNWGPAAFGRLCVETFVTVAGFRQLQSQPPSGGCVLKRIDYPYLFRI